MKLTVKRSKEGIIVVTLARKFTLEGVLYFEDEIKKSLNESIYVVAFNLSGLDFIDSSAIGALMKIKNQITSKGVEFILLDVPPVVMSAFKVAYLDRFFVILDSDEFYNKYPKAPRPDEV